MTPRWPVPHPLVVERFGDPRALRRERFYPVPAYQPGMCKQGPTVALMEQEAIATVLLAARGTGHPSRQADAA